VESLDVNSPKNHPLYSPYGDLERAAIEEWPAALDVQLLREAYERGENIMQKLQMSGLALTRSQIIEISYDIQAGSYSSWASDNPSVIAQYGQNIFQMCAPHLREGDCLLDCGAGELTSLSALSQCLPASMQLYAFDLSLSRIRAGLAYAASEMRHDLFANLHAFVAEMVAIPLADASMDVVITMHALEPNHGRELQLLTELLRVTRRKLLLFEPSWEHATPAIKERMQQHGYVRNLPDWIAQAGGRLLSVTPLVHPINPMNPTYCFVVEPLAIDKMLLPLDSQDHNFICPRSRVPMESFPGYWWSAERGWLYPVVHGVPCLRRHHAVLMSRP